MTCFSARLDPDRRSSTLLNCLRFRFHSLNSFFIILFTISKLRLISSVRQTQSLAAAVIQLYTAVSNQWQKRHCGVLFLIKDNIKRSYFLRVYCLDRQALLWEQEMYNQFDYKAVQSYFHTFEGDVGVHCQLSAHCKCSILQFSFAVGSSDRTELC